VCQICRANCHIGTTCPRIGDLKPKCAKCGLLHKTKNCGIKCGYCSNQYGAHKGIVLEMEERW
jgi:hypothetical protein